LDEYSNAFEKAFMELIRRRWRFKDILAKKAYNEYIQDKEHVHMNATRWVTLSDFVKHLGKAGLCDVNDSDEGLVLRYIDRDPQREAKQAALREREKEELEHREIERKKLMRTLKAFETQHPDGNSAPNSEAAASEGNSIAPPSSNTSGSSGPISFSFSAPKKKPLTEPAITSSSHASSSSLAASSLTNDEDKSISPRSDKKRPYDEDPSGHHDAPSAKRSKLAAAEHPTSAPFKGAGGVHVAASHSGHAKNSLDEIMMDQEKRREREGRKDYWLHPNIVVKVMNKELGRGEYYGQKGTIIDVEETYVAKIRLDSGTVLKLDQEDLETVLPALGAHVLIVNGAYRGDTAVLHSLNKADYSANVSILAGPSRGRAVVKAYEDICKLG
jgi:DNA/RNA-binding protein KIN17